MLELVKLALRITTTAYDKELQLLISSCLSELEGLGVIVQIGDDGDPVSDQIRAAVVAYCKWLFGNHEDKASWEKIYHTKLAQLKTMTGYTDWGGVDG